MLVSQFYIDINHCLDSELGSLVIEYFINSIYTSQSSFLTKRTKFSAYKSYNSIVNIIINIHIKGFIDHRYCRTILKFCNPCVQYSVAAVNRLSIHKSR